MRRVVVELIDPSSSVFGSAQDEAVTKLAKDVKRSLTTEAVPDLDGRSHMWCDWCDSLPLRRLCGQPTTGIELDGPDGSVCGTCAALWYVHVDLIHPDADAAGQGCEHA